MISCPLYDIERMKLFENIGLSDNIIQNYSHVDQFIYLLSLTNQRHLEKLVRFVHISFEKHRAINEC